MGTKGFGFGEGLGFFFLFLCAAMLNRLDATDINYRLAMTNDIIVSVFNMLSKRHVSFLLFFVNFALIEPYHDQYGLSPTEKSLDSGGTVLEYKKWPWLAALIDSRTQIFFCSSSLITSLHVLTAAHCVQNKGMERPLSPSVVSAYFGKGNLSVNYEPGSHQFHAVDILVHPEWKPFEEDWAADIAMIELDSDVTYMTQIVPVCLWTKDVNIQNKVGMVVGR